MSPQSSSVCVDECQTRALTVSRSHLAERGRDLCRVACERDLEGIVGKWAHGTYQTDGRRTSWVKIKNPKYTQIRDRHELFQCGSIPIAGRAIRI